MITYPLVVVLKEEINFKLNQLEKALLDARLNGEIIAIDCLATAKIFDDVLMRLLYILDTYKNAYVDAYKVIRDDVLMIKDTIISSPIIINKKAIIFFPIEKEMTLILDNEVIVLNRVSGTIIFENKDAKLKAKQLDHCKIIHPQGVFSNVTSKDCSLSFFQSPQFDSIEA